MSTLRHTKYITITLGLFLGGCATNQGPIMPQVHGERGVAVKAALAKQIVNPNAVSGAPTLHPNKAAAALERYLNDEVKVPREAEDIVITTGE